MARRLALSLASVLAALVPLAAAPDERFDALRAQAEPLESLPGFVARYVGSCGDPGQRQACEENVKATRKGLDGRLFATVLAERARGLIKVERRGTGFRFVLTPFVDADGFALSLGVPRPDGRGRPTVRFLIVDSAPGVDEAEVEAAFRTGRVEIEILFRPEGAWKLRRRGEAGNYEGVTARFVAVRLVDGRTGNEFASKLL